MNGMSQIAAQVILESAREMFGTEPARIREVSGRPEIRSLEDVSSLLERLEDTYGPAGARGLTQRFGKAVFRAGLRQLGGQAGFRSMDYRILPSPRRVEVGLESLARMVSETTRDTVTLSEDDAHWYWRVERDQDGGGNLPAGLNCFATTGLIQEFAAWASGGRFYRVMETECRASGAAACGFRIDKQPLE